MVAPPRHHEPLDAAGRDVGGGGRLDHVDVNPVLLVQWTM